MGDRKKPDIKNFVKSVGNAVSALSILFILSVLFRTDFDLGQVADWRVFLAVCAAGTVLKTATVFLSGSAWCFWLEFFSGRRCDRREALQVYAKANIGKYLPGNVMHYVERNLFAEKLEMSQKQIAAASVSEVLSLVLAAFFMGALMAFTQLQEVLAVILTKGGQLQKVLDWMYFKVCSVPGVFWVIAAGVLVFAAAAVLAAGCRSREKNSAGKVKREQAGQYDVWKFFKTFLTGFVLYAVVLAVLGIILVILYWYRAGRPAAGQALLMMAAYIIAWVLGFVIPGAPGGIGVREMALTLLLSPVMGRDTVAVLSVWHRMITVAGDFAAYLLRLWRA